LTSQIEVVDTLKPGLIDSTSSIVRWKSCTIATAAFAEAATCAAFRAYE
jgi:hypothetical protein